MKRPPGYPNEPGLQHRQRLIDRTPQTAGRRGPVPRLMTWDLVTVSFVALLIIAAIAVLVVSIPE